MYWNLFLGTPLVPTVLANLALVAVSIWLMQVGLREDRGRPFSAGVLLFLLWAVLRYIDLFGDFGGMLGRLADVLPLRGGPLRDRPVLAAAKGGAACLN